MPLRSGTFRITARLGVIWLLFRFPDKAERVPLELGLSDFESPPRPVLKVAGLAFIETHLCRK
ncbi:MAG: hypothetical protein ACREDM_01235 [Methylocella sp.]